MTSLEALAVAYGFTVLGAFVILLRAGLEALEMSIPLWRSGAVPNISAELADNVHVQRSLRVVIACACLVLATTWFTCVVVWLLLRSAFKTLGTHIDEAAEKAPCDCAKCRVARLFTGDTEHPDDKLAEMREMFDEACPNCGVDLHLPSLCFHQPVELGVCISQWDDVAESQQLLEKMLSSSSDDSGVVDALEWRVRENREL
jgi:hypothetical protein